MKILKGNALISVCYVHANFMHCPKLNPCQIPASSMSCSCQIHAKSMPTSLPVLCVRAKSMPNPCQTQIDNAHFWLEVWQFLRPYETGPISHVVYPPSVSNYNNIQLWSSKLCSHSCCRSRSNLGHVVIGLARSLWPELSYARACYCTADNRLWMGDARCQM